MAQAGKGRLNYRCPSCFMRDLDIDMFYDKEKKEYYCIRCQYTGSEEDVLEKMRWFGSGIGPWENDLNFPIKYILPGLPPALRNAWQQPARR